MSVVNLTETARDYLKSVGQPNVSLSVNGGGCSGFQYTWGLSETKTDDEIIDNILLLDPLAIMYVIGSEIDYVTELGGSYLAVVNPTAKSSCGCGESFSI